MTTPPTGTVTFLFTDIEGSTTRWEHHRAAMERALDRHNAIVAGAIRAHDGHVFKTVGDAYCAAFAAPDDAVAAAVAAQRTLSAEDWSAFGDDFPFVRVRMGLHTGAAEYRADDDDYVGPPLNRAARLMSSGHGGQVLLSLATQQLVRDNLSDGARLVDLGVHRLKGLRHTEHLFRLTAPGFPAIATPPDTAETLGATASSHAHVDIAALPTACPYRGLHAFREADAPFFFGREAFTDLLVESVAAAPMVGVIGPSGSGKSSVVFAGLVPRLRTPTDNGSSTPTPWTVIELRPGSRPFHALAAAWLPLFVADDATEIDRLAELNKLADHLRAGTIAPHDVLARIGDRYPDIGRLLLVADQFEELYTLCPDEDEHRAFQDVLFAAAFEQASGGVPLTLALTLRADFMGHALAYRPFADAIQKHDVKLGPMNEGELGRAIRMPAEAQGRAFESGLVERIVADVGEKAGTLPLLEFALTKLWEHQHAGWLTHEAYETIGRVEGAVARHADAVYDSLGEAEQERSRRVFVQLVQPGEGTEDTRRLATKDELGADWALARKLADARLVTTGRDEAGQETAEVVHEALIRSWGRLRAWMDGDRTFRAWQERLRFAVRQWQVLGRDEGGLLRGAPLAEAEAWQAQRGGELGADERDYIQAGLDLRDRRGREQQAQLEREAASARRLRRQRVFLSIALTAAGALAIAAISSERRARASAERAEQASLISLARELAAAATTSIEQDPERATLLALEAVSATHRAGLSALPEVDTVLHRAVNSLHVRHTLLGHSGRVAARWSPDGSEIATAGYDGTVAFWNAQTGRLRQKIDAHGDEIHALDFSPDGALLATASVDHTVRLWDVGAASLVRTLVGHDGAVERVEFSPDGTLIATSGADKTVRLWQVSDGQARHRFETAFPTASFAFNADGQLFVLRGGEGDRDAVVWDIERNASVQTLHGHADRITALRFGPHGVQVATAGLDRTVRIWDALSGRELVLIPGSGAAVLTLDFNPAGTILAAGSTDPDPSIRLWNAVTGDLLNRMKGPSQTLSVKFSPDGALLATTFEGQVVKIWDVDTGNEYLRLAGHVGQVNPPSFSPDGRWLVTGSSDRTAKVWDLWPSGELPPTRNAGLVGWLAMSRDGSRLATTNPGVKIWSTDTRALVSAIDGFAVSPPKPDFSPDGRLLSSSTLEDPNDAAIWDVNTGQLMMTLEGHSDRVWCTAFSPDGNILASASLDGTARLWDVVSGRQLRVIDGHDVNVRRVVFSPDGGQLATTTTDDVARLWDVATGRQLREFGGHTDRVTDVAFSADGIGMATVSRDGTGHIWDLATGEIMTTIVVTGKLTEVSFNRSGTRIATAGDDLTARMWDAATGKEIVTLYGHTAPVQDALFSPDERRLYTAAWDGTVRGYVLPLDELVDVARRRLTRHLTVEECRQYLHRETCPSDLPGTTAAR